jgi:hypothetical protein
MDAVRLASAGVRIDVTDVCVCDCARCDLLALAGSVTRRLSTNQFEDFQRRTQDAASSVMTAQRPSRPDRLR